MTISSYVKIAPDCNQFEVQMKNRVDTTPEKTNVIKFSKRQLEIIRLWEESDNSKVIAQKLGISVHTVRTQLKRMRNKLNVNRSFEVYKYLKENQMI